MMPASRLSMPIFVCKRSRDEAGDHADRHSGGVARNGCPESATDAADDRAEREATVCGKVAYVQHGIAQNSAKTVSRADETELPALSAQGSGLNRKTYKNSSFCRFVVICRSHAPENRVHGSGDCILMGKVRY